MSDWASWERRLRERFKAMQGNPTVTGCIPWKGAIAPNGYGQFQVAAEGEARSELAHRVAFAMKTGDYSILRIFGGSGGKSGLIIRHTCGRKDCTAAQHLIGGTHADNAEDNREQGSLLQGEDVGTSKLTERDVREIRRLYAGWPKSEITGKPVRGVLVEIAERYGVTTQMILYIVQRRWWKHVE
jgi:hypothetical protein